MEKFDIDVTVNGRRYPIRVPKGANVKNIVDYLNANKNANIKKESGLRAAIVLPLETPLEKLLSETIKIEIRTGIMTEEIEDR